MPVKRLTNSSGEEILISNIENAEAAMTNRRLNARIGYGRNVLCRGIKAKKPRLILMIFISMSVLVFAANKDKQKPQSMDPYDTAELETAPSVSPADLAYRAILFEDVKIPQEYQNEKDAGKHVDQTLSRAISRLESTKAFDKVLKAKTPLPEEPYLLVKSTLLEYRIISKKNRFFAGALSGTSYMAYALRIFDGKSGNLLHELDVTTENNSMSGGWSVGGTDADIPYFLGNVIADYLVLRARIDKGAKIVPIEKVVPDDAIFTSLDAQLMWAAKDNHENVSWDQAVQYAQNFRGGNYSDWRLPSDQELLSLYDKNKTFKFVNEHAIHVKDEVCLSGYMYWTNIGKGKDAKYVNFEKGNISSAKKDYVYSMRVLVVRDAKK
jgi:hypothetical protein